MQNEWSALDAKSWSQRGSYIIIDNLMPETEYQVRVRLVEFGGLEIKAEIPVASTKTLCAYAGRSTLNLLLTKYKQLFSLRWR